MFVSYHEICSRAYNQFFGEGGVYSSRTDFHYIFYLELAGCNKIASESLL